MRLTVRQDFVDEVLRLGRKYSLGLVAIVFSFVLALLDKLNAEWTMIVTTVVGGFHIADSAITIKKGNNEAATAQARQSGAAEII